MPLPKCDLLAVPDLTGKVTPRNCAHLNMINLFLIGANENWGLVTFKDECI